MARIADYPVENLIAPANPAEVGLDKDVPLGGELEQIQFLLGSPCRLQRSYRTSSLM